MNRAVEELANDAHNGVTTAVSDDAAEQLRDILSALPATGSSRDKRVRKAVARAARALEQGRDPHQAAERVYRGR